MEKNKLKTLRRSRRKTGIRKRITGVAEKPRLTVFRSAKHIYAQIVNDLDGKTILSASSVSAKIGNGGNVDAAKAVGTKIAEDAKAAGIESIAFDRNGFRYHGRVKALADAAREAGLKF
ncbi:50S ribosomal protein L18 [Poriferisphaera sp. WC338]|uniref:50S ribosomal protein L18 n=1 Tax=Poriferisphaera sp. WC338 TaxID=3425129 RepID=UPI003D81695A